MGKADGLSRKLDWKVGVEKNNEDQIVIKDNQIHKLQEVVIEELEVELLEKIKKSQEQRQGHNQSGRGNEENKSKGVMEE